MLAKMKKLHDRLSKSEQAAMQRRKDLDVALNLEYKAIGNRLNIEDDIESICQSVSFVAAKITKKAIDLILAIPFLSKFKWTRINEYTIKGINGPARKMKQDLFGDNKRHYIKAAYDYPRPCAYIEFPYRTCSTMLLFTGAGDYSMDTLIKILGISIRQDKKKLKMEIATQEKILVRLKAKL